MSGLLVTFAGDRAGDVDLNHSSKSVIAFKGDDFILTNVDGQMRIETMADTKNVRINSRDYGTAVSGEQCAVQIKPNMTAATQGITGLEAAPRFAEGIAGAKLVGIKSNPDMKGGVGAVAGPIRCFEGKFDGGHQLLPTVRRTVAGAAYILDCMNALEATVTGGVYVIGISPDGGGGSGWTGFIHCRTSGAGGVHASVGGMGQDLSSACEEDGYIDVYIDETQYQIPLYAMT